MTVAPLLLSNAQLLDPATGREGPGAVLVQGGRIQDVAWGAAPGAPEGSQRIDCGGQMRRTVFSSTDMPPVKRSKKARRKTRPASAGL